MNSAYVPSSSPSTHLYYWKPVINIFPSVSRKLPRRCVSLLSWGSKFFQHRVIPYEDQTNRGYYTSGKSNGQMGRILGVTTSMDKLLTSYTNRMLLFTKYRSRQKPISRQWLHVRQGCDPRQSTHFSSGHQTPTLHPIQPPSNMQGTLSRDKVTET